MTSEALLKSLQWRYAVKKFDPRKKITPQEWETLEDALILSASSYGLQPWKFLIVQKPDIRKKLTPASWNQTQVEDSSHFIVFLVKDALDKAYIDQFIESISKTRGTPLEKLEGYRKMIVGDLIDGPRSKSIRDWAARQAYLALGNLMTSAAVLGIDSCPMEGIDPEKYDEILELKGSGYSTLVCLALGHRSDEDHHSKAKKVRFPKQDLIQHL